MQILKELQDDKFSFEKLGITYEEKAFFDIKTPSLIMFGSEADGLSDELVNFSTGSVKIEMAQTVESLNLATSVSVILYELFVG